MSLLESNPVSHRRADLQPDIPTDGHARVIVADGNPDEAAAMARALRTGPSVNVETVDDWDALAALLKIAVYDVVLLTEGFSGLSGVESKKRIESGYRDPPSVILLGPADLRVAVKAFRCGFADYLTEDARTGQMLRDAVQRAARAVRRQREEALHVRYLERLAQRDGETGLPNRRAIEERVEQLTQIKARYSHPFGIVLLRFKEFDSVCDVFGFRVGDQCLLSFGKRLAEASRKADLVGRWDASDFVYLIDRDVSEAGIRSACERLDKAMRFSINADEVGIQISAATGWAMFPDDGQSIDELVARAIGRFAVDAAADAEAEASDVSFADAADERPAEPPALPTIGESPSGTTEWRSEETVELAANPMGPDDRLSNRRLTQRRRTFKRGTLVFNDGFSTVNCIIRDMSAGGVRVSIEGQFVAPQSMELKIAEADRRRPVELRWQRDNQLGLMFVDGTGRATNGEGSVVDL